MCWLSWFLDPGGWSKTAAVRLYFIFPGICTLSLVHKIIQEVKALATKPVDWNLVLGTYIVIDPRVRVLSSWEGGPKNLDSSPVDANSKRILFVCTGELIPLILRDIHDQWLLIPFIFCRLSLFMVSQISWTGRVMTFLALVFSLTDKSISSIVHGVSVSEEAAIGPLCACCVCVSPLE
ncbi:hypothetical protein STEG23_014877, partial [Scotinomys teguina]